MQNRVFDNIVVGGGLAAVLYLRRLLGSHYRGQIALLEKNGQRLGRGVAYAAHFRQQPLNVPVSGMSVDPDQPGHFYNWLRTNAARYPGLVFDAGTFVARSIYGDYLEEELLRLRVLAGDRLQVIGDEAVACEKQQGVYVLQCKSGLQLEARSLVLATGNLPPADIPVMDPGFIRSAAYISNPWEPGAIHGIGPHEDVLIIGSGLTAVDVVLALAERMHAGRILLLSKNGKFPLTHTHTPAHVFSAPEKLLSGNLAIVFESIRNEIKTAAEKGIPWQSVMDALRPWTQKAWKNLDLRQKKIFLQRLRPFWEVHRHRMPAASLEKIETLRQKQQLVHYTGTITGATEVRGGAQVVFQQGGKQQQLSVSRVINCTGPESTFRKHNMPLLVDMIEKGYAATDALNMGMACDEQGRLMDVAGRPHQSVFCMGHLRKGSLWESTAARELREQAVEIAALVMQVL